MVSNNDTDKAKADTDRIISQLPTERRVRVYTCAKCGKRIENGLPPQAYRQATGHNLTCCGEAMSLSLEVL
jgi:hypothetical protein